MVVWDSSVSIFSPTTQEKHLTLNEKSGFKPKGTKVKKATTAFPDTILHC